VVVTEPPPEPATESPEVPREVPALERQPRRPAEARVRAPEKAAPQPLATEEPEPRRRRVETAPAATPPPASEAQAAAPDEAEPAEQPRGKSTQVSADEPEFVRFAYYQVAMRNKISSQWSPPRASEALVCTVHFRIVRSGAVVAARVVESSGLAFFDHTALRAVIESSPLPPLPAEFPGDVVGVTFEFAYKP
jgi:protein TonB